MFRNKTDPDIVLKIESIRKRMLSDRRLIAMTDYGAGSERNRSKTRKVSEIARKSPVPSKYGILLSSLAAEFGGSHIIELGTSFGISTMYMAAGCPGAVISTIEGSLAVSAVAEENFMLSGFSNIRVFTGTFICNE